MKTLRVFVAFLLALMPAEMASAHALQPGYLEITPIGGDSLRIYWRVPDVQGKPMEIAARLPAHCDLPIAPRPERESTAWSVVWVSNCPGGLTGGTISVEGLERTQTDVLVRYESTMNEARTERLTPDLTSFVVPTDPGSADVISTYLPLGFEHILTGIDHLLFVLALLLLIPDRWRLVGAITAFTVAHSITMAVATFGWVTLPAPPVEAIIALSITFVASELVQRDQYGARFSERYPWTVSFTFGLLHGFGFAGALREIGLPQTDIPLALFSFNIGVEIGQLAFVLVLIGTGLLANQVWSRSADLLAPKSTIAMLCAYAIGGVSTLWFIERVSNF